ncbi:MAG TPA: DUF3141 domain-containing protein, partial [Xanthobacteraceae bacterium]|nr:DUF3141 domain-containing protein [Xanthobacteraceae bacterium]
ARFEIDFKERRHSDILALSEGNRADEADFGAVARLSELAAESYDLFARPVVRSLATPALATALEAAHPMRLHRHLFADRVPGMAQVGWIADDIRKGRLPATENPFRRAEALMADLTEQWLDVCREVRDACYEMTFIGLYGSPLMRWIGQSHSFKRTLKDKEELRHLPEVQSALNAMIRGSMREAVVRMLALVNEGHGAVSGARLDRAAYALTHSKYFEGMNAGHRGRLLREQTLIVLFDRDRAIETLVDLLPEMDSRALAMGTIDYIVGPIEEMEADMIRTLETLRRVLELPALRIARAQDEAEEQAAAERLGQNPATEVA